MEFKILNSFLTKKRGCEVYNGKFSMGENEV